jgi:transposase
LTQD